MTFPTQGTWSDDRVQRLTDLWKAGDSASVIAIKLGDGLSRCAILGKVHRLGLDARMPTSPMKGIPKDQYVRTDKRLSNAPQSRMAEIEAREVKASKASAGRIEHLNALSLARAKWANLGGSIGVRRGMLYRVQPEMTKNQLREMLAQAVRNTAEMA